jgi:mRNA interferase MazF
MKTDHDFDRWNEVKKATNSTRDISRIFFKEQEIWWCYLGTNIGYEEDGKGEKSLRPVLVLRKFNQYTFIGLPLTTSIRKSLFHIQCEANDGRFRQAIISQLKAIDIRRLHERITFVRQESFSIIRKSVRELF